MNQKFSRRSFQSFLGTSALGLHLGFAKEVKSEKDSKAIQLYKSLNEEQLSKICLNVDDPKRTYINNWWYVHRNHRIHNTFDRDQIELINDLFDDFHAPEFQTTVRDQVINDMYGRANNTPAVAFFGKPGDPDFEFIYTGHHVTRRCNGNFDKGHGFGGPIFYGTFVEKFNETKDHPGNPYWYQSLLLHKWSQQLTPKQKSSMVLDSQPRSEKSVYVLEPSENQVPGLAIGSLSPDLQEDFLTTIRSMLKIFRKDDVDVCLQKIKTKLKHTYLATYSGHFDIGSDKVYDTWQIEAPGWVWYHRGIPHIHAYFNLDLS